MPKVYIQVARCQCQGLVATSEFLLDLERSAVDDTCKECNQPIERFYGEATSMRVSARGQDVEVELSGGIAGIIFTIPQELQRPEGQSGVAGTQ